MLPFDQAIMVLQVHTNLAHVTVAQVTPEENSRAEKVPRPQIQLGMGQDAFQIFLSRWRSYVRSCKLRDPDIIRDQLVACCDHALMVDIHRTLGARMTDIDQEDLLKEVEKIAVEKHSNLTNINKLMTTDQERDETIKSYYSKLKGISATCELSVTCTKTCPTCNVACNQQVSYAHQLLQHAVIKGLADEVTQQELCSKTEKLTLEDTVAFVEAREGGKKTRQSIAPSLKNTEVARVTAYRKSKQVKFGAGDQSKCKYCNNVGHGAKAPESERSKSCPAYNTKCDFCSKMHHYQIVGVEDNLDQFIPVLM